MVAGGVLTIYFLYDHCDSERTGNAVSARRLNLLLLAGVSA